MYCKIFLHQMLGVLGQLCMKIALQIAFDVDVEIELDPADCEVKPAEAAECVPNTGDGNDAAENIGPNSGDTKQCPIKSDDAAGTTGELKPFTKAKVQSVEEHKKKNCLRRWKSLQYSSVQCIPTVLLVAWTWICMYQVA